MSLNHIEVNAYKMAYIEKGRGEPVLFVHGSLGDFRAWDTQVRFFSTSHRAVSLSLRHCYPERWDGRGGGFSIRQHADDLASFIRRLDIGPVHLVGHSRGAAGVLRTLSDHADLGRTAVLADPAPFLTLLSDAPAARAAQQARDEMVAEALALMHQGELDAGLAHFSNGVAVPGAWDRLPEAVRQMRRDNAWSLKSLASDAREPFGCDEARRVETPVLLTSGEMSPPIYGMMHQRLEKYLPNSTRIMIPEASHGMHWDNPAVFNAAVLDFLFNNRGRH